MLRNSMIIISWFVSNLTAIGMLAFSDVAVLRIVGWIWLSLAVSLSGLVQLGRIASYWSGRSHTLKAKPMTSVGLDGKL